MALTGRKGMQKIGLRLCLCLLCIAALSGSVQAEGWIKKSGRYYYQKENGEILKKKGLVKIGKDRYFLNQGGYRFSGFKKIKKTLYYFQKNGKMRRKKGWFSVKGERCYSSKKGDVYTGLHKIGNKRYYFDSQGRLIKNREELKLGSSYYSANEKGELTKLSSARVRGIRAARSIIASYGGSGLAMSRFSNCFYYLLGNQNFNAADSLTDGIHFDGPDWAYELVGDFLQMGLSGHCYHFACTVGLIGHLLGLDPVTVRILDVDHAYVYMQGGYYDNMGPLFGSMTPSVSGKVLYTITF